MSRPRRVRRSDVHVRGCWIAGRSGHVGLSACCSCAHRHAVQEPAAASGGGAGTARGDEGDGLNA